MVGPGGKQANDGDQESESVGGHRESIEVEGKRVMVMDLLHLFLCE